MFFRKIMFRVRIIILHGKSWKSTLYWGENEVSGSPKGGKYIFPIVKTGRQTGKQMISLVLKEKLMENQDSLEGSRISDISLSGKTWASCGIPSLPLASAWGLFHKFQFKTGFIYVTYLAHTTPCPFS